MPPSTPTERKRVVLCCLFLVALVGVVFYPVLHGELLRWDDDLNISANPHLHGLCWRDVEWAFTSFAYLWRYQPLCWLAWDVIKLFFGLDPFYYHLAVLVIHAANTVLVFLFIRELLLRGAQVPWENAPPQFSICAAVGAALWAVHPLRVETTAWAVELVFVQPLFFFLLSLLVYLRGAETRRGRYISLGLFLLSLLSYPLMLGGSVVFIALDFFPLRRLNFEFSGWRDQRNRAVWLEKIPFLLASLLFGCINLYVRTTQFEPTPLARFGAFPRVMQGFYIWAYYVWRPWLPGGLTPIPSQLIIFNPLGAPFVLSALAVLGLTVLLWKKRAQWPWALAVWLCHLALLVPMLGLSEHPHFPSDRYSLAVNIGWSAVLAGGLLKIWPQLELRRMVLFAAAPLVIFLSVMSRQQIPVWRTTLGFYTEILSQDDPKLAVYQKMVRHRLTKLYIDNHQYEEAFGLAEKGAKAEPNDAEWRSQLGEVLRLTGQFKDAENNFREALQLDPADIWTRNGLAITLASINKLDEAKAQLEEALRQNAQKDLRFEVTALQNLALVLKMQGKFDEARACMDRVHALQGSPPAK